ncbi:phosphatase PAP2 family protein [Candidatus Wolfebacteria bacterium]|nr:phosphatase PAP2 family protein [Candidatus Wolfebacteria bacterium]
MGFDLIFFRLINNLSGKIEILDWLGIFIADYLGYFLIFVLIIFLIREKNFKKKIYFFSLAALSAIVSRGIITEAIKVFYPKIRPFAALGIKSLVSESANTSFPSGHAAFYFALALSFFYLFEELEGKISKKWMLFFFVSAALISVARVFVGIHWPSDILVGAVVGLLSAFLVKKILPKYN